MVGGVDRVAKAGGDVFAAELEGLDRGLEDLVDAEAALGLVAVAGLAVDHERPEAALGVVVRFMPSSA